MTYIFKFLPSFHLLIWPSPPKPTPLQVMFVPIFLLFSFHLKLTSLQTLLQPLTPKSSLCHFVCQPMAFFIWSPLSKDFLWTLPAIIHKTKTFLKHAQFWSLEHIGMLCLHSGFIYGPVYITDRNLFKHGCDLNLLNHDRFFVWQKTP